MTKYNKILENALKELKPIIDNDELYFGLVNNLKIVKYSNDILYIETVSDKALDFIKLNYYETLLHIFKKQFDSKDLEIQFGVGNDWLNKVEKETLDKNIQCSIKPKGLNNVDRNQTFDNYIFTEENRRIKDTIVQILNNEKYKNRRFPFFIYGNVGIGKTHLVSALANEFYLHNSELNIFYTSGSYLSTRLMEIAKSSDNFKDLLKLKEELFVNDIIIIDDFQMFAEKNLALKNFFDIFNEMKEKNIILFLTSDRNIESINGLTDRFMSRINGGIKIQMPTLESISKKKFIFQLIQQKHYDINLTDEAIEFLCNYYTKDIRSLIGALSSLDFAYMMVEPNHTLNANEIIKILDIKNVIAQQERVIETNITPDLILNAIAMKFGIKSDLIKGKSRAKQVVKARNLIFYILNKKLNMNHSEISNVFQKDRTTITTSLKKNTIEFDKDKKIQAIIDSIFKDLHR